VSKRYSLNGENQVITIWTIGHSTRSLAEFLALLDEYGIEAVADVRRFPGSRRLPQYRQPAMSEALRAHGVAYRWFQSLGGRRRPRADSPNTSWRNASFRAYADHIDTAEFAEALEQLLDLAVDVPTALMCAEAVWWRCHRRLIADVLHVRGVRVVHILAAGHSAAHPFTPPAHLVDGRLSYAACDD
jgi:uncharacterized protein (DUF488 family)